MNDTRMQDLLYEYSPTGRRNVSRKSNKEKMAKPAPHEDGISLDGLHPVAAAEDDDEISFVLSAVMPPCV
jgi:hypothetical protein